MAKTKDENFLINLYKQVSGKEDVEVEISVIAERSGVNPNAADNIANNLARGNLIYKERGDPTISLTSHGITVAKSLLNL